MCTQSSHEAIKLDASAWSSLTFVGYQRSYAEPEEPPFLELRNCACGSTLCRPSDEVKPTCTHDLVEVLSTNGRNLDGAIRRCAGCGEKVKP